MKIVTKTLLALALGAMLPTALNAQTNTATATATAVIISPITIVKTADMSFGDIVADADGGTVTLNPVTSVRTPTGISVITGSAFTLASFTVAGQGNYTYSVTLPASATIDDGAGGTAMTVNSFTSSPSGAALRIDNDTKNQVLTVGATLNIGANQTPGTYTSAQGSGAFAVTVNYN